MSARATSGEGCMAHGQWTKTLSAAIDGREEAPRAIALEKLAAELAHRDVSGALVHLTWELSRSLRGATAQEREALELLLLALLLSMQQGNTYLPLDRVGAWMDELGVTGEEAERTRQLAQALCVGAPSAPWDSLFGLPGESKPLLIDRGRLYPERLYEEEMDLARQVESRLRAGLAMAAGAAAEADESVEYPLQEVLAQAPQKEGVALALSAEQQACVRMAIRGPLTIISGGPGTGKTSIIATVVRVLMRLGTPLEAIALAASTGRAARRMAQALDAHLGATLGRRPADDAPLTAFPQPQTLHRLLGYLPRSGQFRHHHNNRLLHDVVIVDECSMIDLGLMRHLLRSVRPGARLVLLGDADQLPSVEAGAVFRELVGVMTERTTSAARLGHSFRMDQRDPAGAALFRAAQAIQAGNERLLHGVEAAAQEPFAVSRATPTELKFEGLEWLPDGPPMAQLGPFLDHWYERRVHALAELDRLVRKVYEFGAQGFSDLDRTDLARLFGHFESFRILCLTRGERWATGAARINARLHRLHVRRFAQPQDAGSRWSRPRFYPGEPIIALRNDDERGISNGDQGLVLRVATAEEGPAHAARGHHFMAVFAGTTGYEPTRLELLGAQIELAFATTVHKSQGSELDYAAVILPEADLPLLSRELLYTAVTRSRKSIVLIGQEALFARGVGRRAERTCGLGARLGDLLGE